MDPCWNHSIDSEKGPFFKEHRLHKQGSTIYLASNRFFMIQSVESFNSKGHVCIGPRIHAINEDIFQFSKQSK